MVSCSGVRGKKCLDSNGGGSGKGKDFVKVMVEGKRKVKKDITGGDDGVSNEFLVLLVMMIVVIVVEVVLVVVVVIDAK